ncbi:MAG: DUF5928 domain-containing protein [Paracoccaceae bacterium]|nr:DUF5928 domain-containing protein [Paracoccaceae bacterium]
MAKIAFILLCHKDPGAVVAQARRLTATGDHVAIHFDRNGADEAYDEIVAALDDNDNVVFAPKRVRCGWGEWSLVEATLGALRAAVSAFPKASHFYLISGDCMPIKSARWMHDYLDEHDGDFIESFDFFTSDWIKTGFREERLVYRHLFNERRHKRLFYGAFEMQRRLGLKRQIPDDLQMMIGSQWWCLRRPTVENVLRFIDRRRDVVRFFRTTWIPDESFFQTLVRHLVPEQEILNRTPTFLVFSDYGMPVTFYNDHYDLLLSQDYLFARKISAEALQLKERLGQLFADDEAEITLSGEGRRLYSFLTGQGRIGQRFAPRFWERDATIGRERVLMIVTCKKWHVARRLLDKVSFHSNIPALEYIFDEEGPNLPDLGGIEDSLGKRARHRRALMRMLFDYYETDQMIVCLDPANLDLVKDFYQDRSTTKLLEIECTMSDAYLIGHARRVGLAGETTPEETLERLLPTIRNDVILESDRLRDERFPEYYKMRERADTEENAAALAGFLPLKPEITREIAETPYLFAD